MIVVVIVVIIVIVVGPRDDIEEGVSVRVLIIIIHMSKWLLIMSTI